MKKVFLSFLLTAGVASFSHAQGVQLGLRAGVNLANYAGEGKKTFEDFAGVELKQLVGFHGGVTLNAPLSSDGFFSLQPELLYSQKGFRIEEDDAKQTVRHHFIDLPLLARINADGLIFEAGPQLGYLAASKSKLEAPNANDEEDSVEGYNRFQIGYIAGVGYQFASGPSITVRYNGGITGVEEDADDDMKARNSVFQFSLGYTFGGK
ncbi:porin family protein [Hymenobacter sp. HDW8]|uniref:porin family protein n=1 Tax=Hymenobacter sp. HDW8 TaxID=2714932 RepID=UPI001407905D|nr:porin family protein [Hymenobacter sp. HDW8]QIL76913.1 PorT family protein [Hymenobacter sp. HDW8]